MTWRPAEIDAARLIRENHPSSVRVTNVDGERLVLRDPGFSGDSIVGWVNRQPGSGVVRVTTAASSVRRIETRHFSLAQTGILVATPVVLTYFLGRWICRDIDC